MGRLQEIENRLASINEAVFQELCDHFLSIRNKNVSAFSRTGSQQGKQKTVLGTPDSAFLLPNGKYIFVEYSTNVTKGVRKLEDDILKCLDTDKTGIPKEQIAEIIICINFRLSLDDLQELRKLVLRTRIVLTVYTIDELAIELHLNHRDLVHQYLGLSLDTGQIVSIDRFISDYNSAISGLATPLDNTFLHRQKELSDLNASLEKSDLIILTGAPGVGKTKLALESIKDFVLKKPNFKPYCLSYKHHALLDDLNQYFDNSGDYILFVDDANRIDAFEQIIGFFKSIKNHRLKLIITVRDYAYSEINRRCIEYLPIRIDVQKLTDQQILDIIKADPFKVTNSEYYEKIVAIADGNPRIAIMVALLAKAHQNVSVLHDVSELFERYFTTFIKDKAELENPTNLKSLGLISFFYTLPYKNRAITELILRNFNFSYLDFIEIIDKLDKLEIVEVQYEYVKIPEQNLASYFFYKAFVKDELLSFKVLLEKYFETNSTRFRDTVIPVNNTFGARKVMDKLLPSLRGHWKIIKSNEELAYKFIQIFDFYLQDEALEFAYNKIVALPKVDSVFEIQKNKKNIFHEKDQLVNLLSDFFYILENLKNSIELLFEYVRKCPTSINDILNEIREHLLYDREDYQMRYCRQILLFEILDKGLKTNDRLSAVLFYELAPTFLSYHFNRSRGGRKNTIFFYEFNLPDEPEIRQLRDSIWRMIDENYESYPQNSLEVLNSYSTAFDVTQSLMEYEVPLILNIIEHHLKPSSFANCNFVQTMILQWKNYSITSEAIADLAKKFTNDTYEIFLKVDWNRYRDKEIHDFDNYTEYEKLKEREIRSSFKFKSVEEIESFYKTFTYLRKESKDSWNYSTTLDIIIDENISNNFDIGLSFLQTIINTNNEIGFVPHRMLSGQLKEKNKAEMIWNLITSADYNARDNWELTFYDFIADDLINSEIAERVISTFRKINGIRLLYFEGLKRFLVVKPDLFQNLLGVMVERNKDETLPLRVWMSFFDDYFDYLGTDINLIEEAYLQQIRDDNFDYDGKGFKNILLKDKEFLIKYLECHYKDRQRAYRSALKHLGFIWDDPEIENVLENALDFVVTKETSLGILEHFSNSFFYSLKYEHKSRAGIFLMNYVKKNYSNEEKMNMVVDICRHWMKDYFEELLLLFISLTQDEKLFSKILWRGSGTSGTGDVILADIEAADWRNVLSIVSKSDVANLYRIKRYLNEKIDYCIEQGNWERKQRFLDRY